MNGVITGIGLVTAVGSTLDEVFDAVCDGRSGLRRPPEGHPVNGVLEVAGIAPEIHPDGLVPGPEWRTVDRHVLMSLRAAADAVADAGLRVGEDVDPERVACVISGTGGLATFAGQVLRRADKGRLAVSPYLLPGVLPNMAAARVAIAHGIRGYSSSIATACASGAQAVAEALRLLRAGEADAVVCGCAEALLFDVFAEAFGNARALAQGWADPAEASRPFDRRRNGFVLSEGAAVLVVERPELAAARGAAGHAEVLGWGVGTDAHHPTTPRPDGEGPAQSMRRALAGAGLGPADVGYVNAHGTGTKLGDAAEAAAIRRVFGAAGRPEGPPVSSIKGVTGHMLGASGAVEVAVCAAALGRGMLPPTRNLDDPDPACALDHVVKQARVERVDAVLTNSFGFGGHNVSLVLGRAGASGGR
ncbi:beta-ketoacyl-[acyl-carrier-protein] synthase family protein [Micromonospora eburnea]|nr:beta-ketoacyl-[acyl-carrier-protein] synthase family protein [Micromonospora eburnea]